MKQSQFSPFSATNVFFCLIVLVLDQLTKQLALNSLVQGKSITIIPGLFDLTLVFNPGAAFGLFGDLPTVPRRVVLGLVLVVAIGVILRMAYKEVNGDRISLIALSAVLGGAVGNLLDRVRFDAVVDFLDFYWNDYHWPAFNIADSAISVGVVIVLIRMVFFPSEISNHGDV